MDAALRDICQLSDPCDPRSFEPPIKDFFCIYPMYRSRYEAKTIQGSNEFLDGWNKAIEKDGLRNDGRPFLGCNTIYGNYVAWAYPECLPERAAHVAAYCDWGFFWDDATDAMSMEKNHEATKDLILTIMSTVGIGQKHEPLLAVNKLVVPFVLNKLAGTDGDLGLNHMKAWKAHLDGQARSSHANMSWEELKQHRLVEGGPEWAIRLGAWGAGIRCTAEEIESVRKIIDIGGIAGVLANDYYSFNKEFDEHSRAGTIERMQNGVALLMREYGYSEEEAREILKKEINKMEQQFMDMYLTWLNGPVQKSRGLIQYLTMVLCLYSGTMFWMAHGARYHRTDLITTAEDRATIVGKCQGDAFRVMEGYPPPKGLKRTASSPESAPKRRASKANNINQSNGHGGDPMVAFSGPFVKAPSHICDAPYEYINSLQSKNMRDKFINILNSWLNVPSDSLQIIKNIVQMLHNSSLMLDDIEDASPLRRGQPATHIFYGASQTINSANFSYVKTVIEATHLKNPQCLQIFLEEVSDLHRGQSLDLHWRHHGRCPTTDEYIMMVDNKTGGLFRLMARLMEAESPSPITTPHLSRLLTLIGRYYQIRDDYMNLTSADYTTKKGYCEDLDEGKFSLPLIHLLLHTPCPDRITSALYNRVPSTGLQEEVKTYILDAMQSARTFEYVREVLSHLHGEIMKTLDEAEKTLGINNGVRMLLVGLGL
ncbi:isoprenoid synthase domain-containing protein [Aspergillus pseudodeflectus]|uniref:Isoprenoid synthase domain-containing protein n=1 Tax=Aspergillus pseudodeflectus TaxID=176178 RepID=A0ABR4L3K1_9EURO